ncbi:MAG: hypothetical protein ACTHL7_10815, partial [Steroidobacteraceae bacterium]
MPSAALLSLLLALVSGCEDSVTENSQGPSGTTAANGQGTPGGGGSGAPSIFLSASPTSVSSGGTALLIWSATNASSCTASGGWTGDQPSSGSASTGSLSGTTSYTLNCIGPGGSASRS